MSTSNIITTLGLFGFLVVSVVTVQMVLPQDGHDIASKSDLSTASIVMYKDPYCGCCGSYAAYLREHGYDVEVREETDMAPIKDSHGVSEELMSCHTMEMAGYTVEGHVPIEAMRALLEDKPDIDGIALAGMPAGSPGMGGEQNAPYQIRTLSGDSFMEL